MQEITYFFISFEQKKGKMLLFPYYYGLVLFLHCNLQPFQTLKNLV